MSLRLATLFAALALTATCQANVILVPDIGDFSNSSVPDNSLTFTGTGFVGMYRYGWWTHLFGLEASDFSRTIMQIDLSSYAGVPITSAILQFSLLKGYPGPHGFRITSFDANGTLAFSWDAPQNLGTVDAIAFTNNSIDITSLVQSRLASNQPWLGLHFQGTDAVYMWTFTSFGGDEAQVRLLINTSVSDPVPEPGSWLMLSAGLAGLAFYRRR